MPVLDDSRLAGIEAVHRGFLYQHLYAVECLLACRSCPAVLELISEGDEDIEVVLQAEHRYIQVKYRTGTLQISDLASTLERFARLREEHANGRRPGVPSFFVVCNRANQPGIMADPRAADLGLQLITPEAPPADHLCLPLAAPSVQSALDACSSRASLIPHSRLDPSTLVWKLATEVALAAAGTRVEGHRFRTSDLDGLLELFYRRLQRLPVAPVPFLALESEPDLDTPARVRLIVAMSGGGKTAWIAERALHLPEQVVYFDVADNADATLVPALVREIVGTLADAGMVDQIRSALYAGASGLTSLRALDGLIHRVGLTLSIVVDNAHRAGAVLIRDVAAAAEHIRLILLAQPSPSLADLKFRLGCSEEVLGGLSADSIATDFKRHGTPITVNQSERLKAITGGLPLLVRDAAMLAGRRFAGNVDALCDALEGNTTPESTGQDVLLRAALSQINPASRATAAVLALSDVRLTEAEAVSLVMESLVRSEEEARRAIRELVDWGIVQLFANLSVSVHDVFRHVLRGTGELPRAQEETATRSLGKLFRDSITPRNPDRFVAYCRIAPRIGETAVVIDLAGSMPEHLHEHGLADAIRKIVVDAVNDPDLSPEDRFWAIDTVTFWDVQRGAGEAEIQADVERLEQAAAAIGEDRRARQSLSIKKLLVAGKGRDLPSVRRVYAEAVGLAQDDEHHWLILRYTYAVALIYCDELEAADLVTHLVARGYLRLIGLDPQNLFMKNAPEIREALGSMRDKVELIKHVADAVDLRARVVERLGGASVLLKMWAFKLYALANSPVSAVKVGMDVVDGLLGIGEVPEARKFMEKTLIPGMKEYGLAEEMVPLRAQYAVVLAWSGSPDDARKELASLAEFAPTSEMRRRELENQQDLVERIAAGAVRLRPSTERNLGASGMLVDAPQLRLGRNDACVCGSGLKFKRCCGR